MVIILIYPRNGIISSKQGATQYPWYCLRHYDPSFHVGLSVSLRVGLRIGVRIGVKIIARNSFGYGSDCFQSVFFLVVSARKNIVG